MQSTKMTLLAGSSKNYMNIFYFLS